MDGSRVRERVAVAFGIAMFVALAVAALVVAARAGGDMTGEWKLDPRRSDAPPMGPGGGGGAGGEGRGHGGWGGGAGGGGYGGHHHGGGGMGGMEGGGPPGGMGGAPGEESGDGRGGDRHRQGPGQRPVRLPDLMHVTEAGQVVSFEDSTGRVLQEIAFVDAKHDTLMHAPGATVMYGTWRGDTLDVERDTPFGRTTQSWWLDTEGRTLVQRTRIPANGERAAMEFHRVYQRTGD